MRSDAKSLGWRTAIQPGRMPLMEAPMDKTGPRHPAWWISLVAWAGVIVGVVAILAHLLPIAALFGSSFWLLAVGWLLLAIAAGVIYAGRLIKW